MASTKRITVFGTVHAPLFNPVIAAKEIVTADHIGGGRFGLDLVVGWNEGEFEMFGVEQRERSTLLLSLYLASWWFARAAEPEHLELALVPTDDEIEAKAAAADVVCGHDLLGGDHGVETDRRMHGAEHGDAPGRGQQARRPGERLQGGALVIGGK